MFWMLYYRLGNRLSIQQVLCRSMSHRSVKTRQLPIPVIHYEIQISRQSDFAEGTVTKFGIVGTISPVAIPNAEYGKYYFVRVAAINAGGLSDFAQTSTLVNWTKPIKNSAKKLGGACTSNGSRVTQGKIKLVCKTVGGKLIWKRG